MEDKLDKVYTQFMDSVFDLAIELSDREIADVPLTENELKFIEAFDAYLEEINLAD